MQLDSLKRKHPHRRAKRVGRSGARGKTSGRGTKGQKARAGHKMRPEMRDIIKKYPKHRGYQFKSFRPKPTPVNLDALEAAFASGDAVNPASLLKMGVISKEGGRLPAVKILGTGKISKKFAVTGCATSKSAKAAIEAAGGTVAPMV